MSALPLSRSVDLSPFTSEDLARVRALASPPVAFARNQALRREREAVGCVYLLLQGWVVSSMLMPSGQRQIIKVHIPGDLLGAAGMAVGASIETLTAVSDGMVAAVPFARLRDLFETEPRMAALFLMSAQVERIALMDTVASIGKSSARERLITFLLDLHDRLAAAGLLKEDGFDLLLTQEQIGDAVGLTSVHVNRTVRQLEREGLILRHGQRIRFGDLAAFRRASPLPARRPLASPEWLPRAARGEAS